MLSAVRAVLPGAVRGIGRSLVHTIVGHMVKFGPDKDWGIEEGPLRDGPYSAYTNVRITGSGVRAAEFGFHGIVSVRSHLRKRVKSFRGGLKAGSGSIRVRGYRRLVDIDPKPFIRPAMHEMPTIKNQLEDVVVEALKK
jgi:hypothetical protein